MGSDESNYDKEYYARLKEQLEREKEAKLEQHRRYLEYSLEQNRKRNREILKRAQNSYDNQVRDYIIKSQGLVGYNLNPYKMTSKELEYCQRKISNEINELNERNEQKMENVYNQLGLYDNYIDNLLK